MTTQSSSSLHLTAAKFLVSCVVFFLLAVLYEGLKYYREVLLVKSQQQSRQANNSTAKVKLSVKEKMLNANHGLQTILHFGQVFISYILMLLVMFCNLWWILAICLGAACGYFAFGWLKKAGCSDVNECCY
jgi:solute carrier family 31 (copper transporter), member 1